MEVRFPWPRVEGAIISHSLFFVMVTAMMSLVVDQKASPQQYASALLLLSPLQNDTDVTS